MKESNGWYRLRRIAGSNEVRGSLLLFIAAAIIISLPFLILMESMVASTFVLSGFICFIIGLIMLVFYRGDLILQDAAAMLTPGLHIAFGKIITDIGGRGGASIIPCDPPLQFIPINGAGIPNATMYSHMMNQGGVRGLGISPPSLPLWHLLRTKYKLIRTGDAVSAFASYAESIKYALELADRVDGKVGDDRCIIEIRWYRLFEECALIQRECGHCCTMVPCGICGLAGLILVDGTNAPWSFDQIELIPETRSIRLELSKVAEER